MISPELAPDEARRLAVLRQYDVLDTPPEQALDDLAALAAHICAAPISLISMVDESRQWFKARVGLETAETRRELSFCAHALRQAELLIVPDAAKDERFAENPLVTGEPGIRFYAGAPLIAPDGAVLGTLCVIDRVPRTLSPAQEQALRVLARQVMTHLELHRQSRALAGSERLFQTIFDVEPECVKLLSANGRVQMMNAAGLRLVEVESFDQIAGDSVFPLIAEEHRPAFIELTERVFRGETGRLEYQITGLRGTPCWLEIHAVPLRNEGGAVTALLGISRDITERHLAKELLDAKSMQLQAALKVANLGVWYWNLRLDEVVMLHASGPISGLAAEIAPRTGKDLWALVHPDDRPALGEKIRRAQAGEDYAAEFRVVLPGGEVRWVATRGRCLPDSTGDLTILPGVDMDITERKQSEELRSASEARYRTLFECAPDGILIADAEGRYLDANASICRMLGFTHDELIGLSAADIVSPTEFQNIEPALTEIKTGAAYHRKWNFRRKNESVVAVEVIGTLMPDGNVLAMIRDISGRQAAEAQLKLLETCVARLNDIVLITEAEPQDEPGPRILFVNDAFTRITGYSREEVLGRSPRFLQGPKTSRVELDRVDAALRQWRPVQTEVINYTKSGREIWLEMDIVPLTDSTGRCTHWVAVERDITERKRSEARFRWLVDSNAQGVMFWKTNGAITGCNDAFLKLIGYSRDDLEAGRLNWAELTPFEYAESDRRALSELAAKGVCTPYEKEFICKDGSTVPLLLGAALFVDNPEEGVCFTVELRERKRLELQFLRAQRMESIGTLAGGIAHDLNNSLGPIITSIQLLQMHFPDPQSQELLAIIESSARRGADMVRQVLSFARGVEGRRMEVQIKHIAQEVEQIVRDTFLKHIRLRTTIPNDLQTVMGDPTQIHQVLLNLCVNARDAMPHGGTLTLSAENLELDEHYAALNPEAQPGSYVMLKIEDSGTGMSPEVLERIYDPFFTTKEVGKGTGLGLSTSLAIVKSHGGFLRAESKLGKGTTFEVYLPALPGPLPRAATAAAVEVPRGQGELILVVDDEASFRAITQRTLQAFGYKVVLAADGTEAVSALAIQGAEIAAVITDMTMPVMDGLATIRALRKMSPKLPIAAASGLPENPLLHDLGVTHFLPKPYTAAALLKVVGQLLSRKQ